MLKSPARMLMALVAVGLIYLAWAGYISRPNLLERIQQSGELTVITRVGPATYYQSQTGLAGLEYELVNRFAEELGVELRLITVESREEIFQNLASRRAHLAAAGLTATETRLERFQFTEPYMTVHQQLVYRLGERRPRDLSEIEPGTLKVVANSSYADTLRSVSEEFPNLEWEETQNYNIEELLYRIWNGEEKYTVANSNEVILHQTFYPELRSAFDLSTGRGLAWAFPRFDDDSLFEEAEQFFHRIREDGTLAHLLEKYYGHLSRFDYVGTRTYLRDITERLPQYRPLFKEAAEQYDLDWRLLAAIGYQESHWNPRAVSPTGVRGIMMLTLRTAGEVGVTNRLDPEQSIFGGARYFAHMHERVPDHIEEPVRTWLALAAYNVGLGHLEDARIITEQRGGDPNSWVDVKENLPLLAQREWYTQTRFGYARGWEPVRYVENIRAYYELLVRITEPGGPPELPADYSPNSPRKAPGLRLSPAVESAF
ncbi:lytic transglycosylase F [Alkalilimnicola ehrlichii]|uniref:Membrane-bound lytic murein transglycosylase F n=1 Tax=Alkalilimnicola ehrlichii TaxID=351052 RepID=A0A3E0WNT6_9GAMM|nr:membrane-bound lytic murein transglycosylase MltF [Alkalilimnicola ehrlichii]RFA29992.1 lytic transglycosylase F [Alkalilimnicola ehrlichii]RFA33811.1 lytic transglycosylase F [Alkalilimnicola ehrlichii]